MAPLAIKNYFMGVVKKIYIIRAITVNQNS